MAESYSLIKFSNTMLAHVAKHFNYNLTVYKGYAQISIYFWTFGKFIGNVNNHAISQPEQQFFQCNGPRI